MNKEEIKDFLINYFMLNYHTNKDLKEDVNDSLYNSMLLLKSNKITKEEFKEIYNDFFVMAVTVIDFLIDSPFIKVEIDESFKNDIISSED